ncbi:Lipoxygenase, C-terminal [Phytophthora cactorum]|nr:Lipoxygenase, C-terminal [Phytophthora cactorum]
MKFFLGAVGVAATLPRAAFGRLHRQPHGQFNLDVQRVLRLPLSIVHTVDRAAEIAYMATNLKNEKRSWPIDGKIYQSIWLQTQDLVTLSALKPDTPELMAALAMRWLPQLNSTEAYTRFYELFHPIVDAPRTLWTMETLRGFNLRAIRESDDDPEDETLTAENVAKVFATVDNKLFIVDLATIGQWGDPSVPKVERDEESVAGKYLPSVIGYFCFNEQLLPLAIKLVDSDITYTPFDSADEWQLAKTALNAAEATFQQMQHFSESHTLSIPIRVELYRAFAEKHPVRALLMRHFALDFGLEQQAGIVLFNTSTPLDRTFGIGAAGCVRLLEDQRTRISLLDDVYSDARERGIQQLPHKYVAYGKLHADAISTFVGSFLDVYYADDDAVKTDVELQQWAAACAKIPHLRAFPAAFENKETLHKLLARLVYQSVVKHHAMNGEVTWTTVAMPYSAAALWKPLPSRKEPTRALPGHDLPQCMFNRPRPEETTLTSVYHVAPFTDDPRLHTAIERH